MYIDQINELLFKQMEILSTTKKRDILEEEIEKAKAMALLASQYIAGETLQMRKSIAVNHINKSKVAGYLE